MAHGHPLGLDPSSSRPPFEQVRAQLAEAIADGALAPEDRLPTIRELAADLGLAVNTVARAYRELEAAGLVETRGRNGTFVVGTPTATRREAAELTRAFVARLTDLGFGAAEIQATVRHALE